MRNCVRNWKLAAMRAQRARLAKEEIGTEQARLHRGKRLCSYALRAWCQAMPALREERQSILLQEKLWLRSQHHLTALANASSTLSPKRREISAAFAAADSAASAAATASPPRRFQQRSEEPVDDEIGKLIRETRSKLDKLSIGKDPLGETAGPFITETTTPSGHI
jgi:hypothetical protein